MPELNVLCSISLDRPFAACIILVPLFSRLFGLHSDAKVWKFMAFSAAAFVPDDASAGPDACD